MNSPVYKEKKVKFAWTLWHIFVPNLLIKERPHWALPPRKEKSGVDEKRSPPTGHNKWLKAQHNHPKIQLKLCWRKREQKQMVPIQTDWDMRPHPQPFSLTNPCSSGLAPGHIPSCSYSKPLISELITSGPTETYLPMHVFLLQKQRIPLMLSCVMGSLLGGARGLEDSMRFGVPFCLLHPHHQPAVTLQSRVI